MATQPDRDPSARRDEAMARLAVTTEALGELERALAVEPDLPDETARTLLAGSRALCPVAVSTGAELAVSAGPDHAWRVHVRSDGERPHLHLHRPDGARRPPEAPPGSPGAGTSVPRAERPSAPDVAVQLADLLRASNRTRR